MERYWKKTVARKKRPEARNKRLRLAGSDISLTREDSLPAKIAQCI